MDFSDTNQMWLLILSVAGIGFLIIRSRSQSQQKNIGYVPVRDYKAHAEADKLFASLSPMAQAEVDQLLRDKKLIYAIKLIKSEANVGLQEAKSTAENRRNALSGKIPH